MFRYLIGKRYGAWHVADIWYDGLEPVAILVRTKEPLTQARVSVKSLNDFDDS